MSEIKHGELMKTLPKRAPFSKIIGTGSYIPDRIRTNKNIVDMLKTRNPDDSSKWTTEDWIIKRTGIKERRWARPDETNYTMGALALEKALKDAKISAKDLGGIILATNTAEKNIPPSAGRIQEIVGTDCGFSDVIAGCSGFSYALAYADGLVTKNPDRYPYFAVVASDKLTDIINFDDRSTCILFGDMASAVILQPSDEPGVIDDALYGIGKDHDKIVINDDRMIEMDGKKVFGFAARVIPEVCIDVLKHTPYTIKDVSMIIPHNANLRIIDAAEKKLAKKTGIPLEEVKNKFHNTVSQYGNTSTASYPNTFHEARKEGLIKPGELVILVGFGAGLTYGANLLKL